MEEVQPDDSVKEYYYTDDAGGNITKVIEAEVDGGPYDSIIVYKAQKGKGGDGGGNGGGEKPCKGNSKKPSCINQ